MNDQMMRLIKFAASDAARVLGETFEHDGASYTGVFTGSQVDQAMQLAGYNDTADYLMRARKDQFGETLPSIRSAITWRGGEWRILQVLQPANDVFFIAAIKRRE